MVLYIMIFFFFFFFKQKTAYEITTGDWSSDVCSSDLRRGREAAQVRADEASDLGAVRREWVPREIEPEGRPFLAQALRLFPTRRRDQRRFLLRTALARAEEAHLSRIALGLLGRLQRDPHRGEQAGARGMVARVDAIEGAGAHQRLDHAPVDAALVHALAKVEQVPERTVLPRREDRGDRRFAGALHCAQAVAD